MLARIPWGARIFALVWLTVALLPPLRECFTAYYSEFYNWGSFFYTTPLPTSGNDLSAVSAKFSTDFFQSSNTDILKQWDEIAAQHPREIWLRADRLRSTFAHGFFNSRLPEWATPEMFAQSIECARRGQEIQPENGFWFAMEATLAFKAGRVDEARSAMRRAAKTKSWNDYTDDATKRQIALYERVRPLIYEEKLPIQVYPSSYYLGPLNQMARELTKQGIERQAHGDIKGAFDIFSDVLGVGQFIHQHSNSRSTSYNGWFLERNVWREVAKQERETARLSGGTVPKAQSVVATFGEVARRAGHPDLTQSAQSEWDAGQQENDRTLKDAAKDLTGISSNGTRLATQGTYLLMYVARLAFAGALLWIFGRLWTPLNIVVPTRGEIARSANFSFWGTLGALALAWFFGVGGNVFSAFMRLTYSTDALMMPRALALILIPLATFLLWLLPVAWMTRNRQLPPSSRPKLQKRQSPIFRGTSSARLFLSVLAVGFWLISLQSNTTIWNNTPFVYPVPQYGLALCALALLCLEVVRWRNVETRLALRSYLASSFAISTMVSLALISTSSPLFALAQGKPTLAMWLLPTLVMVGFGLTFVSEQSKEIRQTRKLDFFIAGASRTAGVLAVVWSLFFLVGAGIIWPIRAQLNHQLDQQLVLGEKAWRAQLTE